MDADIFRLTPVLPTKPLTMIAGVRIDHSVYPYGVRLQQHKWLVFDLRGIRDIVQSSAITTFKKVLTPEEIADLGEEFDGQYE